MIKYQSAEVQHSSPAKQPCPKKRFLSNPLPEPAQHACWKIKEKRRSIGLSFPKGNTIAAMRILPYFWRKFYGYWNRDLRKYNELNDIFDPFITPIIQQVWSTTSQAYLALKGHSKFEGWAVVKLFRPKACCTSFGSGQTPDHWGSCTRSSQSTLCQEQN